MTSIMMKLEERGRFIAIAGVCLFIMTIVISSMFAPMMDVDPNDNRKTLIGSQGGGPGWHEFGSVYLLEGANQIWKESSADSYFDATVIEDGKILVGFMDGKDVECPKTFSDCSETGFRIIDVTEEPKIIDEYSYVVKTKKNSEVHAVSLLDSGEFLMSDMDMERIFTVKDGEITWSWEANEIYDAPKDPTERDWLHINDVDVIGDGRYLVSVRNANQILIIERGKGVTEIINSDTNDKDDFSCKRMGEMADTDGDGDIRCGDPSIINHQHNPQWLEEGRVLVADSDNNRIVELQRSEMNEWEPVWALYEAGGIEFRWPRDADKLPNGNILITDTLNKRVIEVNPEGEIVWGVWTKYIPYEADRLPYGEINGLDSFECCQEYNEMNTEIPIITKGMLVVRVLAPGIPYWFGEIQLVATAASLILMGFGWKSKVRKLLSKLRGGG